MYLATSKVPGMHLTSLLVAVAAAMLARGDLETCMACDVPKPPSKIATDAISTAGTRKLRIHPTLDWSSLDEERAPLLTLKLLAEFERMYENKWTDSEYANNLGVWIKWSLEKTPAHEKELLRLYNNFVEKKRENKID
ncbi:hypothetical protein PsorP6_017341 [Peronosclerospora sorghi]|uniref:Uncharacterized protein n=1 Tax=Peronosclerospora sorghi TaxID=230839 RepID=A0ACC0WMW0_9STRA|nr:hypothetical protein PsorP6_017341 [Peronosclerospora sorghi]